MLSQSYLTFDHSWQRVLNHPIFKDLPPDLKLSRLGTFIPAAPCCAVCFMQQGIKFSEGLTWMTRILLVLWFDITYPDKKTENTRANRLTHKYKYILTPPTMCKQLRPVLQLMSNLLIKKFTLQRTRCLFFARITCKSHDWLDSTWLIPSCETRGKLIEMILICKTHTHKHTHTHTHTHTRQTQRKMTLGRVSW